MKYLKRIITIIMSVTMLMSLSLTTFAASGINENEQAILDALSTGVNLDGRIRNLPAEYINQASNYMLEDGVDITKAEADEIIGYISQAIALIEGYGLASDVKFSEVPQDLLNQVLALVEKAAAVLGLTVSIDTSGARPSISIVTKSANTESGKSAGTVIGDSSGKIKQTGIYYTSTVLVIGLLVSTFAFMTAFAKKRKLFA